MTLIGATEDGPIGRLDPRTRVIAALLLVIGVIALSRFGPMVLAVVLAGALVISNPAAQRELRHRLLHVEGFMIVLLLMLPVTVPGETLATLGPLTVSRDGLERAMTIVLKVNAAALVIAALIGTLEPVHLGHAMAQLRLPQPLVHLFLFAVRYVAVFRDETRRLRDAMRARAFRPGSNLHTWRSYGNLAGMILVRSLARADRVDEAMRARGFSGRLPLVYETRMSARDAVFGTCAVAVALALVAWDRIG